MYCADRRLWNFPPLYKAIGGETLKACCHRTVLTDRYAVAGSGEPPAVQEPQVAPALARSVLSIMEYRWSTRVSEDELCTSSFSTLWCWAHVRTSWTTVMCSVRQKALLGPQLQRRAAHNLRNALESPWGRGCHKQGIHRFLLPVKEGCYFDLTIRAILKILGTAPATAEDVYHPARRDSPLTMILMYTYRTLTRRYVHL